MIVYAENSLQYMYKQCTFIVKPNTHRRRRRDETVESRRVGVGGVYWALLTITANTFALLHTIIIIVIITAITEFISYHIIFNLLNNFSTILK